MTTPPSYSLIAHVSALMEAMSKWFVGLSRRICGCSMANHANTTLDVLVSQVCIVAEERDDIPIAKTV